MKKMSQFFYFFIYRRDTVGQALTTESNTIQIPMPKEGETIRVNSGDGKVSYFRMPKKKVFGNDGFGIIFQESMMQLAISKITGEQCKVLFYLVSKLEFDNKLFVSQTDMSEKLNMNKGNISRALKALERLDVIKAYPKTKKFERSGRAYMFNPLIIHKGANNYKDNKANYEKMKGRD